MASVGTVRNTHWKTTSPIPPDPIYDKYSKDASQSSNYKHKSPIPKDPVYSSPSDQRIHSPKPRVKPEALAIARNHQGKDLAFLFNPAFQVIPIGVRPTHRESKDFNKENFKKIKQIQRANKEKQSESSRQTPVKVVYKPNKFDHVESKVTQRLQTPTAPRPNTKEGRMQRSHSMSDISKLKNSAQNNGMSVEGKKSTVIERKGESIKDHQRRPMSARNSKEVRKAVGNNNRPSTANKVERPKSHIVTNKESLKNTKLRRSPSMTALDDLKKKKEKDFHEYKRGEVPRYLQTRQQEWKKAEEERVANLPDPTIPEGHTLMKNEERLKTLALLTKSKSEMTKELQAVPFGKDTLRLKNHKDSLERKLQDVDAALKIFSRPKVFIKDE